MHTEEAMKPFHFLCGEEFCGLSKAMPVKTYLFPAPLHYLWRDGIDLVVKPGVWI